MARKVICAGHVCLDITPVFQTSPTSMLTDILQPGKLVEMGDVQISTGGSVANTGLAMKFFGADVQLMGKVGQDSFGQIVHDLFQSKGAGEGLICSSDASTSYSVVLAVPGVDRIFLHHPGANHHFYADDLPQAALEESDLLHFGYPPLMHSMYEQEGEELLKLMKRAKAAGCVTSLDLAAVDPSSEAGQADWERILTKVLPYVDLFLPSVEELCYMLDRPRFIQWQQRAKGGDITDHLVIETDVAPLAQRCMELGCKVLLIKCGAPGLYYRSADSRSVTHLSPRFSLEPRDWASREGFQPSYQADQIRSGTGCGDTTIAAFLTSMLEGKSMECCLRLAAATGACCVAAYDALSGLRPFDELEHRIHAGWKTIGG